MKFRNIITILLNKVTGLPSRSTFLEEHVLPAKKDDKFNNNRCAQCWCEYTEEHPGVKILPCGHVFGRDCLRQMVKGPTGDLCPFCRVKLFRRDLNITIAVTMIWNTLLEFYIAYMQTVDRLMQSLHRKIRRQPLLKKLPFQLILGGPHFWAKVFVRKCTNVSSRNPKLVLNKAFIGSSLIASLYITVINAPILLLVYFLPGSIKVWLPVLDLAITLCHQYEGWTFQFNDVFDHPADRTMIACIAAVAVLLKELIFILVIWYCCG